MDCDLNEAYTARTWFADSRHRTRINTPHTPWLGEIKFSDCGLRFVLKRTAGLVRTVGGKRLHTIAGMHFSGMAKQQSKLVKMRCYFQRRLNTHAGEKRRVTPERSALDTINNTKTHYSVSNNTKTHYSVINSTETRHSITLTYQVCSNTI